MQPLKQIIISTLPLPIKQQICYWYLLFYYLKKSISKYENILIIYSLALIINTPIIFLNTINIIPITLTSLLILLTIFMTKRIILIIHSFLLLLICLTQLIPIIFIYSYSVMTFLLFTNCIILMITYLSDVENQENN
jgi:hypothetical protein